MENKPADHLKPNLSPSFRHSDAQTFRHLCLAIDIGNTQTKVALYGEDMTMGGFWRLPSDELNQLLGKVLKELPADARLAVGWISTNMRIALDELECWRNALQAPFFYPITPLSDLPIQSLYQTPETLGADRIVGVIAACSFCQGKPVLVIDAGTAITYDAANRKGVYLGGGISPGMNMRFRALEAFTARLPLIASQKDAALVGTSTETSIRSGVQNGVLAELEGIITQYQALLGKELQVFLTGGDASFFENRLKNVNFASPNLLLEGIYTLLQYKSSLWHVSSSS